MSDTDSLQISPGLAEIRRALRSGDASIKIGQAFFLGAGQGFYTAQVMVGRKKIGRPILKNESGGLSEVLAFLGELLDTPDDRIEIVGGEQ